VILPTQPGALVEPILGEPKQIAYKPLDLQYIRSPEVGKARLDVSPRKGAQVRALLRRIIEAPKDVQERALLDHVGRSAPDWRQPPFRQELQGDRPRVDQPCRRPALQPHSLHLAAAL
jgi:hypothetical protein